MTWRVKVLRQFFDERITFCWACGRDASVPAAGWHGPWWLQLAHLRAGGGIRAKDRRAVNLLCPLCHTRHSHKGIETRINGVTYCGLSDAMMLWIKRRRDPLHYDEPFVQTLWIGLLPEPVEPPEEFRLSFVCKTRRQW